MVVQYRGGGRFSLRPGIQERGRLPRSRGIGGTGDPSFSGEHGLRVARGFISVLNAAKDDDRERVCSGVSVATSPAGEREKLRRRTKPGRAGARGASRDRSGGGGVDGVAGGGASNVKPPLWRLLGVTRRGATSVGVFGSMGAMQYSMALHLVTDAVYWSVASPRSRAGRLAGDFLRVIL